MACSIVFLEFWNFGGKQSCHQCLTESTYIVVGTLKRKWDFEDIYGWNGKILLMLFYPTSFCSFVQFLKVKNIVDGGIIANQCWESFHHV
jgi:hypothetical protein